MAEKIPDADQCQGLSFDEVHEVAERLRAGAISGDQRAQRVVTTWSKSAGS
jgi:hypothetical protein